MFLFGGETVFLFFFPFFSLHVFLFFFALHAFYLVRCFFLLNGSQNSKTDAGVRRCDHAVAVSFECGTPFCCNDVCSASGSNGSHAGAGCLMLTDSVGFP